MSKDETKRGYSSVRRLAFAAFEPRKVTGEGELTQLVECDVKQLLFQSVNVRCASEAF
jgi:hypothetical protein